MDIRITGYVVDKQIDLIRLRIFFFLIHVVALTLKRKVKITWDSFTFKGLKLNYKRSLDRFFIDQFYANQTNTRARS